MKIMKRLTQVGLAVLIAGLVLLLKGSSPLVTTATAQTQNKAQQQAKESTRSFPPDTTPYTRPAVPEDFAPKGIRALFPIPGGFIVDAVVNNTDPNLTNTDTFDDGETSITVNPASPGEIVITAFSGSFGGNAALWHSTDGGNIWSKQFTIPSAPGVPDFLSCDGGVCDQTVDYGRGSQMSGTFLATDIHSGTTTNPASAAAWNWLVIGGVTQMTNHLVPSSFGNADQPWLLVNRDPTNATQDNMYAAYDDFGGALPDMRVAVSFGVNPPNFTIDNQSGTSTGGVNPGHRLAVDRSTGAVYSLFQRCVGNCEGGPKNIDYMLNRSTDGGATWTLN